MRTRRLAFRKEPRNSPHFASSAALSQLFSKRAVAFQVPFAAHREVEKLVFGAPRLIQGGSGIEKVVRSVAAEDAFPRRNRSVGAIH
jgi:hypothetical protein